MANIRPCRANERETILAIVNTAAEAHRHVIPPDRWREPYMPSDELDECKTELLETYWTVPDRQIETSVVLASPPFAEG